MGFSRENHVLITPQDFGLLILGANFNGGEHYRQGKVGKTKRIPVTSVDSPCNRVYFPFLFLYGVF
jgi:hypothetical protein